LTPVSDGKPLRRLAVGVKAGVVDGGFVHDGLLEVPHPMARARILAKVKLRVEPL
jgi:hypothetical protein